MRAWLQQLRICSGHFRGGRKSEGDIPVADPEVDDPIRIDVSALHAAVKQADKTPKCRRTAASANTPTGQKLAPSKNPAGLSSVRPVTDKSAITSYTGVELHGRWLQHAGK